MATWYNLTFAYKEVLASAKMNQFDGNFDALAEGASGAPDIKGAASTELLYDVHRQDYTTDNVVADQTVRKGWAWRKGTGFPGMTIDISFDITFDDVPIIVAVSQGHKVGGGDPTAITDFTASQDNLVDVAPVSTTGFTATIHDAGGVNLVGTNYYAFTWIAIGSKSK